MDLLQSTMLYTIYILSKMRVRWGLTRCEGERGEVKRGEGERGDDNRGEGEQGDGNRGEGGLDVRSGELEWGEVRSGEMCSNPRGATPRDRARARCRHQLQERNRITDSLYNQGVFICSWASYSLHHNKL